MSNKISGDLLNFFREIVQTQNSILLAKKQLSKTKHFNASALFGHIAGNTDAISIEALKKYVQLKIACNDRELYSIFQKFDHSRLGYLIKQDFVNQLTIAIKQTNTSVSCKVTHEIQHRFLALLSTINKAQSVLNVWRQELKHVKPFIFFQAINTSKTGVINPKELFQYFFYQNQQLNRNEVQILYRGLLRRTQKQLNLEVFCLNFNPLQFGYYPNYQLQLQHGIEVELKHKKMVADEAQQVQQTLESKKRNNLILQQVHKQAALSRELQLQNKIKDEIRAYQELKFLTVKKYHPHLSYDYFLYKQKENEQANIRLIQSQKQKVKIKEAIYRDKIRNVETMIEVEKFQRNKTHLEGLEREFGSEAVLSNNTDAIRRLRMEKQIKSHAFSKRKLQDALIKGRIEQGLVQRHQHLKLL